MYSSWQAFHTFYCILPLYTIYSRRCYVNEFINWNFYINSWFQLCFGLFRLFWTFFFFSFLDVHSLAQFPLPRLTSYFQVCSSSTMPEKNQLCTLRVISIKHDHSDILQWLVTIRILSQEQIVSAYIIKAKNNQVWNLYFTYIYSQIEVGNDPSNRLAFSPFHVKQGWFHAAKCEQKCKLL